MSVGTWDPHHQAADLGASVLNDLLAAAGHSETEDFNLTPEDVDRLAVTAHANRVDWRAAARNLGDAEVVVLVRLYTLAEGRFPAWKAGANSAVVVLAKALRERGAWPAGLTAWIKRHSDNKFLPYGSLLGRI